MSSFTRQTLKKTVRKSNSDGRTYVYPHRLGSGPQPQRARAIHCWRSSEWWAIAR